MKRPLAPVPMPTGVPVRVRVPVPVPAPVPVAHWRATLHRGLWASAALAGLAGCAERLPLRNFDANAQLRSEIASRPPPPAPAATASAPAAAPAVAAPAAVPVPVEARFDLIVNGANARDVFLGMVADTRYSMLMHPEVAGLLSVTLRGVTVREALESIRDVYGYDFKIDGRRITVYPPTMQTRLFTVNYLHNKRQGKSEVRVAGSGAPTNSVSGMGVTGGSTTVTSTTPDSSQISTSTSTDIWTETAEALRLLIGSGAGRAVITSPQAGTIAVRAMPDELRQVELFLKASKIAVERQVMLEAKIVEVELREGFQSGIDWSLMRGNGLGGQTSGYPNNPLLGNTEGLPTLPSTVATLFGESIGLPPGAGGTLGLSIANKGFQAVLGFLESHGNTQVLSSPRVATLNNQKAVLKVGTDEYFVTNVSGGSVTPGNNATNGTTSLPTVTLTPFFSGIALDVTPQIDEGGMITLHLRPSVTVVTEKTKRIDLGQIGNYKLPLASSSVNETDTVVRVPDGYIVAIGGLMQMESSRNNSGFPGANTNDVTRTLLSNTADTGRKKELVVLIRPTVIRNNDDWERTTQQAVASLEDQAGPRRVVTVSAPTGATPPAAVAAPAAGPAATPTSITSADAQTIAATQRR
jgi:MSHA biogenesis protein MshL